MKNNLKLDILGERALSIRVCTNAKTKKKIEELTNKASLCGTTNGWILDEKTSKRLRQEKVECSDRRGYWHYILYA